MLAVLQGYRGTTVVLPWCCKLPEIQNFLHVQLLAVLKLLCVDIYPPFHRSGLLAAMAECVLVQLFICGVASYRLCCTCFDIWYMYALRSLPGSKDLYTRHSIIILQAWTFLNSPKMYLSMDSCKPAILHTYGSFVIGWPLLVRTAEL